MHGKHTLSTPVGLVTITELVSLVLTCSHAVSVFELVETRTI